MDLDLTAWRATDGAGDHPTDPAWGAAGTAEPRLGPADPTALDDTDRPGARAVSNAVFQQSGPTETPQGYSDFLWAWGQFIDHDLSLTPESEDAAAIPVPTGDPLFDPRGTGEATIGFHRSGYVSEDPETGQREFPNVITSFLDGSMIYGSSDAQQATLMGEGAFLAMDHGGDVGDMLPKDGDGQYLGGDVRAGENLALTSLHTLFAREHNRIVTELAARDPDLSDDELFTLARRVVEAEIQKITFDAFLPKILGPDAIGPYQGFDASVDPTIALEFSTAAFRFGHTLLSPELQRLAESGADSAPALALREAFFNPQAMIDGGGIEPLLRGLADRKAEALDAQVIEDVRSFLFGPPGAGGFDLAALNIQRGRDHGIPTYNELRQSLGLDVRIDFSDVTSDMIVQAKLAAAYTSVDDIDAWVGGLAEDAYGGGLVGELFHVIIRDQFEAIRAGDPFWSAANPLPAIAEGLGFDTLGEIILANSGVEAIQRDVFLAYDRQGGGAGDDSMAGGSDRDLLLGVAGDDRLAGRDGDDQLEGGDGDDVLNGGAGDDLLLGGAGDDRLYGLDGDDEIEGGSGDDQIGGGDGADILFGGAGDDRVSGQAGDDRLVGGDGDDRLVGGAGDDEVRGDAGDDVLRGDAGRDMLYGGRGDDDLIGGADGDRLFGEAGDDRLFGQGGDDILVGGWGADFMAGGAGDDMFVFAGNFGFDRISDFRPGDVLVFRGFDAADIHVAETGMARITVDGFGEVSLLGVRADTFDADDAIHIQ